MAIIISEQCINCGSCVNDCARKCLKMGENSVEVDETMCNLCGHCIAVCPARAVSITEYDMNESYEDRLAERELDAASLLETMRFRRSIRNFQKREVEKDKLEDMIEAGRYAPTACNFQSNRFVVVKEDRKQLLDIILNYLNKKAENILEREEDDLLRFRAEQWREMHETYQSNPDDLTPLMFNAPVVLLIVSEDIRDGSIAAAYMELEATAHGLGILYNGYISNAVNECEEAKNFLGIKENEIAVISLLVGYPGVRYKRNTPRLPAQVKWK